MLRLPKKPDGWIGTQKMAAVEGYWVGKCQDGVKLWDICLLELAIHEKQTQKCSGQVVNVWLVYGKFRSPHLLISRKASHDLAITSLIDLL